MTRRLFPLALLATSLAAALLVARLPEDLDQRIVTRRHHNSDPLLTAALLQLNARSLLHDPARYFEPPILFPDPNPYRSTEPFISETLLSLPFRLALGERPGRVYTLLLITTLALVGLFTGLLLRELGVRAELAVAGGCLAVTIATTTVFLDRLQSLSIQWLPLGLLFASRYLRLGTRGSLAGFAVSAFLTVQASLYTSVMLVAAALFLAPLGLAALRQPAFRARVAPLLAALLAAATACLLVLLPYLRGREDVAAYASAEFAASKPWGQAFLQELAISPPEYGRLGWPLEPWASWDGVYPGAAFGAMLAAIALAAALARVTRPSGVGAAPAAGSPAFAASKRLLAGLAAGFAAAVLASALGDGARPARVAADLLLWALLATWCVRLWLWPLGDAGLLRRALASAAWLAALVLLLLSLGSPVAWSIEHPPLLHGLFGPLSSVLPALRELRELKRFLLPAGWAAVIAAALSLELRLAALPARLGPALAACVVALALLERARADTRSVSAPAPPAYYELLGRGPASGGLLELPIDQWGRISSVRRMLWQPSHGRPIVAGKVSLDPPWYTPASALFEEFPSQESVRLLRAWRVTSVLDARPDAWREPLPANLPDGLALRADLARPEGPVRLFEVAPGDAAVAEPDPGPGHWVGPDPVATAPAHRAAADGSVHTAAEVAPGESPVFVSAGGAAIGAVEIDYGVGRQSRVPREIAVQALMGGTWTDVSREPTGRELRLRAAFQLMRFRRAALVIVLREPLAKPLRLVAGPGAWDLPELRMLEVTKAPDPGRPLPDRR